MNDDEFYTLIYELVSAIPAGKVATYGQLAFLAGFPGRARMAGRALATAPPGLPCHRVVNASGGTAPGWSEQRALLEKERVRFKTNGRVDMVAHQWDSFGD